MSYEELDIRPVEVPVKQESNIEMKEFQIKQQNLSQKSMHQN